MPCTPEATEVLRKANVLMAPAVAAGAGGVDFSIPYAAYIDYDTVILWLLLKAYVVWGIFAI